jgi:dTDP-4-amino-4,6-dideoxygalactose transaminase
LYVVRVQKRDDLAKYLLDRGIETKVHYPIPIHLQKASAYLGYRRGDFRVTEDLSSEMLSLPVRENLSPTEMERICAAVAGFYRGN